MKITNKTSYISPFPKKNEEFINSFYLKTTNIASVNACEKNMFRLARGMAPLVTKSYMSKNPFYFDMKKRNELLKGVTGSFGKASTTRTSALKPHCVIDMNKVGKLLGNLDKKEKNISKLEKHEIKEKGDKKAGINSKRSNSACTKSKSKTITDTFGVIPEYIKDFKVRQILENEFERLIKEEKSYPIGTIKLPDEERLTLLNKAKTEREISSIEFRKLPVSSHVRSIKIQNYKRTLESKLEETEYIIKILERTEVFVKK